MATESLIGIVIQARDEATRVLQQVRGEMALFGPSGEVLVDLSRKAGEGAAGFDRLRSAASTSTAEMVRVTQAVRALAVPLANELAPAFGQASGAIVGTVARMSTMTAGLGLLGVAAAGVASVVGGALVAAYQKAEQSKRDFSRAISTGDIPALTKQMKDLSDQIDELARVSDRFGRQGGPMMRQVQSDVAGKLAETAADVARRQRERELIDFSRGLEASEADVKRLADEQETRRLSLRRSQRSQFDFRLDPIEAQFEQAQREADALVGEGQREAAVKVRAAAAEARAAAFRRRFRFADFATAAAGFDESFAFRQVPEAEAEAIRDRSRQIRNQTAEAQQRRMLDLLEAERAGDEGLAFQGPTPQQREGFTRSALTSQLQLAQQRNDLEREHVEMLARVPAYSQQEADSLEERIAGLRQAVDLKRLDLEITTAAAIAESTGRADDQERLEILRQQRDLVSERFAIEGAGRERARVLRDDPLAGARQGAQDFEDLASRQGERYRNALFQELQSTSAGITEILVSGISGDFDRVADVGKQMGRALMRGLLQELVVTPLVAALSGAIKGALGSLGSGLGGAGTAAAGGGGLAAILGLLGLAPRAASAAQVGVSGSLPVGSLVATAAGPATVAASGALVLTPGGAAVPVAGADLVMGGGGMAPLPLAGATPSLSSAVLGGAAGAAAVGFTAYSAYQTATTTTDVAFAGVTGAIAGAAAGAAVGGYFGSSGYGALIGAVAGAAIAAGAGAFGKSQNRQSREERQQAEVSGVAASFQAMFAELDAAQLPEDLYAVVKRYTHQAAGGERSGQGNDNAGLVVLVTITGQVRRVIDGGVTPEQLVEHGQTAAVQIIAGVAAEAKAPFEERIGKAIQQAAARIKALGPRLFFSEDIGGGITRTTVLGLSRLAEAAGQNLNVVMSTLEGLDPGARQRILDKIAQNDVDGAIGLYAVETNLQVVRVGGHVRAASTGGPGTMLPPVTAEGVPLVPPPPLGSGTTPTVQGLLPMWVPGEPVEPLGVNVPTYRYLLGAVVDDEGKIQGVYGPPTMRSPSTGTDQVPIAIFGGGEAAGGQPGSPSSFSEGGRAFGPGSPLSFLGTTTGTIGAQVLSGLITVATGLPVNPLSVITGAQTLESALGFLQSFAPGLAQALGLFGTLTAGEIDPDLLAGIGRVPGGGSTPGAVAAGLAAMGFTTAEAAPPGLVGLLSQLDAIGFDVSQGIASTNFGTGGAGGGGGAVGSGGGPGGVGGPGGEGGQEASQHGGWVAGEGRGDTVPAVTTQGKRYLLEPEEFIVNRDAAAEHPRELEEINRYRPGRFPRAVPGMSDEEVVRLAQRMASLNRRHDYRWWLDGGGPLPSAWAL